MSETLTPESAVIDEGPSSSSNRTLLVLLGALVLTALVGFALYVLVFAGSSDEDLGPVPGAASQPTNGKGDKATKGHKQDKVVTVPAKVDEQVAVGRDPFQPLSVEKPKPTPEPTADPTSTGTSNTQPGGTVVTPTPAPTTVATETYDVTLVSSNVKKEQATISVDGRRYVLSVKDVFPSSSTGPFKLVGVGELKSGKATAVVVFGSDAPVELVENDEVTFTL